MSKKIKHRISGSTILEALVAMVISITVFTIALVTIANLNRNNNQTLMIVAKEKVNETIMRTSEEKRYFDESIEFENLVIEKKLYPYELPALESVADTVQLNLMVLEVTAFNKATGKQLLGRKLIIEPI